jgi:hypothetical protein
MIYNNDEETKQGLVRMFGQHPNVRYVWRKFTYLKGAKKLDKVLVPRRVVGAQCNQLENTLLISSLGQCTACCQDLEIKMNIGDVNKESILDIWNGEKRKCMVESIHNDDFSNLPLCGGCLNDWNY